MTNIPIFLSSDNNYSPFVATTIASICDNTNSFCEFYILDAGISDENTAMICGLKHQFSNFSVEFLKLNLEKLFSSFPETDYITKSMYTRFLIPDLKPEIDKAIYSDVDVIVLGDIAQLYNENLEGYALGAVWEEFCENNNNVKRKEILNLDSKHKYFSSGCLLIDCKQWRTKAIFKDLHKIGLQFMSLLSCPDQDILNKYFDNNYKQLPTKFCWTNQCCTYYSEQHFTIRHFNGPVKPWHINEKTSSTLIPNVQVFWKYAKMTPYYKDLSKNTQNKNEQQKIIRQMQLKKILSKAVLSQNI